ncbi:DUF262 domain-containing protein [Pseudomonas sp. ADAK2]|uniref:DUF262 domain-containing protein n=1 Tax=unclassified Pseudomonas TaxID=196821 RepID=UPI001462EB3D|nr:MULTISPECIES: DUF262 domain-containing protein [unclassified Pseudomonas]QJI41071.1 DUF262 domain-containing protein [Pseudomonas sp. ADAK7]QJI47376.1 DUF262 domain-containing protein [Pseudomonas sp. ADAK2]
MSEPPRSLKVRSEIVDDNYGLEPEIETSASMSEPFDPSKIRVQTERKTIDLIFRRYVHKEIDLAPDFQRRARLWPLFRRSQLIESLLLKIPLPVFYVAADQSDHWAVVDGLQRITTIVDFLSNDFALSGLEYLSDLENCFYSDLDRAMKRRIEETELVINIIQPGTPDEVMMNIFKRINTGGIALNGQEIRNAIHKGPARELLRKLSTSTEFLLATDESINDMRMAAQELVLRFIAFLKMNSPDKPKNLDNVLNSTMKLLNSIDELERFELESHFKRAMHLAYEIFGTDAFRKPSEIKRNPINKALFESWGVNLAALSKKNIEIILSKKELLIENYFTVYENDKFFVESITTSTGHNAKILKRFMTIASIINATLNGNRI